MNKPAPQEPSMDEILSSIRQIIADDDGSNAARRAAPPAAPPVAPMSLRPQAAMPVEETPEPLALSPSQIVSETRADHEPPLSYQAILKDEPVVPPAADSGEPELVDPEDVTFAPEPPPEPVRPPSPPPSFTPRAASPRPATSFAQAAPMPDPRLSADIAERLIEPATRAAVQHNFARLNSVTQVPPGQTIDGMMRDMLRPMLKAWLDEHLPSVVERMVEKEIARISRGVE